MSSALPGAPAHQILVHDCGKSPPHKLFTAFTGHNLNPQDVCAAGPEGRAGVPGPPIFLSNAHFCDVDPAVADTVVGLNCSQADHVTSLDVEPMTGITMRAAKRLMMSTQYGPGILPYSMV